MHTHTHTYIHTYSSPGLSDKQVNMVYELIARKLSVRGRDLGIHLQNMSRMVRTHTHTHTHIYIYTYIDAYYV
jgi:hypothetical protein